MLAANWSRFLWPPVPRALVWLSYTLQTAIQPQDPVAFRTLNVTLHGLNAFLVFLLLRDLISRTEVAGLRRLWPALLGAVIFLVHPLQTESVIYVYQRSTLLSSTFFLSALLLGLQRHPSRLRQWLLVGCVTAALLSKEWTLVLPLLIWLEQGLLMRDWKPRPAVLVCFGLSILAALGMVAWMRSDPTLGSGSSWEYARLQVPAWWKYLRLLVLPVGLSLDHSVPLSAARGSLIGGAAFSLGTLYTAAFWFCRKQSGELFALAIFFLALLPTSSVIPAQDPLFEHRMYAPLIGISVLIGLLLTRLQRPLVRLTSSSTRARFAPQRLRLLCWFLLPTLVILTVWRSREWHSQESIWTAAVHQAPEKYRPRLNLGRLLMSSAPEAGEIHMVRAIELRPDLPHAFRSLASLRQKDGDPEAAADLWQQALLLEPGHAPTHLALGQLRMDQRRYFEARLQFQQAIRFDPEEIRAYRALALLEAGFGFPAQSLAVLDQALAIWPNDLQLIRLRAGSLFRLTRWQEASAVIRRMLELGADDWQTLILAGQIYLKLDDYSQAE